MASNMVAVNRSALVAGALLLVALGAGGTWILRPRTSQPVAPASNAQAQAAPAAAVANQPVTVTLTKEAAARAGIELATVTTSQEPATLRIPGVVQPNAYKTVSVTPLTAGRVTRVVAELGQPVRRGQLLAEIYSPELTDARTKYLSERAELSAHELEVQRTEKLVAIGAASKQELERIHAEHVSAVAMLESYRSKLSLLGLSDQEIQNLTPQSDGSATLRVTAPSNGVVTARGVNVGLNVDSSMSLFTIADLSDVWVVGDLYERDFPVVMVGATATVVVPAYPDLQITGKVAYIDPQVKADTRTAQVRVEVPNPKGQLRLGMLAEVRVNDTRIGESLTVPRAAVQTVGNRTLVYVADPSSPERFVERDVTIDASSSPEVIRIRSGLKDGDVVVTKGSFSLRAEHDRVGGGQPAPTSSPVAASPQVAPSATPGEGVQTARILVTEKGYEPATVTFKPGASARLTFIRTSEQTCGTEVVVPSLNIRRPLPLNQAVDIEFTAKEGAIDFACGMEMLKGVILVK